MGGGGNQTLTTNKTKSLRRGLTHRNAETQPSTEKQKILTKETRIEGL